MISYMPMPELTAVLGETEGLSVAEFVSRKPGGPARPGPGTSPPSELQTRLNYKHNNT